VSRAVKMLAVLLMLTALGACSSVKLTSRTTAILVAWNKGTQPLGVIVTGYNVFRSVNGKAFAKLAGNVATTSYEDTTVSAGNSYCYKVQSLSTGGQSPLSTPVCLRFNKR
jgi:fibronectin type 3 domain-containing protein